MGHIAKLGVQGVPPGIAVTLKELTQGGPDLGGGGIVVVEDIEDFCGDPGVKPLDDGEVVLDPLGIIWARDAVGGDVGTEVAAAKV